MKKIFSLKLTGLAILMAGLVGCNSILEDVEPPTSVSFEVALNSPDAVRGARASMYSAIRASFDYTTQYLIGPSSFSDELSIRSGGSRFNNLNFAVGTSGEVHLTSFGSSYNIIRNANMIIGAVSDGVLPAAELNRYRGEAFAIRAFIYHNLARTYGYEPGRFGQGPEANWNLAVTLRTVPTLSLNDAQNLPRNTVTEVYTQILADLAEAKTLLAGQTNNQFITEAFVDAMTARVNLYAGNWAAASTAAQAAITGSGRSLVATQAATNTMFRARNPESLFELQVNPNTEAIAGSNINNGMAAYTSNQWVDQLPTNFVIGLYDAADFRLTGWYSPCSVAQTIGTPATNCNTVNTGGLALTKWNGWRTNLADDIPYFRLGEVYLIWAEAAAKAANDPNAGVAPLQALRTARNAGAVPAGATASITAFEDEILLERVRELVGEGHRFYDLKRLGRDILLPNGNVKMRADSYRILAPFGTGLQNVNSLLVENPGYPVVTN
jgi:starch-binding outer membrane protein, SusD/RagB family